jgi:hypothetical protein
MMLEFRSDSVKLMGLERAEAYALLYHYLSAALSSILGRHPCQSSDDIAAAVFRRALPSAHAYRYAAK